MDILPDIQLSTLLNIVLLSLIAGLGTGIGGLIAIMRTPGRRSFGFLMGLTAGVMITLAFMELLAEAWETGGFITATIGFAFGAGFMFLLDYFAPHMRFGEVEVRSPNPDEVLTTADSEPRRHRRGFGRRMGQNQITDRKLFKTGMLLAIGITIHNIPEGIAVGAGYLHQPQFGVFIAMAILLHNIPEGIATALPLNKCGVCRWDAFRTAFLSGLAEPVGALVAALFLTSFTGFLPAALAFAGGVMLFITLDELLPAAREHGHQHWTAMGIIAGSIFVLVLSGIFGV